MPLNMTQKLKVALLILCIAGLGALAYSWVVTREGDACWDYGHLKVSVEDVYGNVVRDVNATLWFPGTGELIRTDLTDNEGEVSFGHLPIMCYNLTLTKKGFQFQQHAYCFTEQDKWIELDCTLYYLNFTLAVNVTDAATRIPIENATVQLYRYNYLDTYEEWNGCTNSSGVVTFTFLEYDEYAMAVSEPAYFNYTALLFMDRDQTKQVSLQAVPSTDPDPESGHPSWREWLVGVLIGFMTAAGVSFFWIQRRLQLAEEELSQ